MNNISILVGRITQPIELRYTTSNKAVVKLNLAINNSKEDTTFLPITVFGKLAETVSNYCKKGDLIGIQAIIKNHNWTDNEDKTHYDYNFIANKITFLQSKKNDNNEQLNNKSNSEIEKDVMTSHDPFQEFGEQISIEENFLD